MKSRVIRLGNIIYSFYTNIDEEVKKSGKFVGTSEKTIQVKDLKYLLPPIYNHTCSLKDTIETNNLKLNFWLSPEIMMK